MHKLTHHGGHTGVTGSCHELCLASGDAILVDCGTFQGADKRDSLDIEFPVDHIRALVVTHVHIDHVGRIPWLLAAGFHGPIYCSEASAALLPLVMEDAIELGITRIPHQVRTLLRRIEAQLVPLPYKRWQTVCDGLAIKLQPAGHILGSAYVECKVKETAQETRVVFSGDLGAPHTPLLPAPKSPYRADELVLECTYGDRTHASRRDRRDRLQELLLNCLRNRGTVLIPAFSIGRTQELLYELEELIHRNQGRSIHGALPWDELEIIVDSPLAAKFTDKYRQLRRFWDDEALGKFSRGRHPLSFENLYTVDAHQEHKSTVSYLKKTGRPCIVLAASGMCSGGRIVNYLKALLGDPRTDLLFVGYQGAGTPGRSIQKYGPRGGYVELDGQRYDIKAGIHTVGGYSAHADQQNLINFVKRMRHKPKTIHYVHGEPNARAALQQKLRA